MQERAGGTGDRAELRRRAEQRLEERRQQNASSPDPQRLVQELQVHQFELEIQNEELQRARDDLETLLGRYQDLYDFAPVGYFSLASDGTILEANLAGAALLELERARLGGRGFAEFVPLEARASVTLLLSQACAARSKRTCEAELQAAASQRRFQAHLEAVGSADGQTCRVAVIDTSERRRIEAALEASEARYRLLFESSEAGLLLLDAGSGEVLAANEAFCRLLGDPAEAFLGRALWELEQFIPVVGSRSAFNELQGQGGIRVEHLPMETDDGRQVDVALFSSTYQAGGGHVMQLGVRDIGERLRSERELRAMQELLEASQKLEAVGRLAGGVAHEFNNDLGVIIGHADLLRRSLPEEGPACHRLDQIEQAARHSAGLTHQLLAYARKQVLQPRRVSPSALVAELRPLLLPLLGPGVELGLKLRAEGCARIDPKQFGEALTALVANACGGMPEGGALVVETADVDVSCVGAEAPEGLEGGRYVTVSVSDSGAGLDATARARLFDPFFSLVSRRGSTGLSLAAVHGTIKQSGGHVFVESRPGHGTVLTIYLPREERETESIDAPKGQDAWRRHRIVMVVEDEPASREWVSEVLRDGGYEVLVAAGGEQALALAAGFEGSVDLLLTDVLMPAVAGPAVAERLLARWPAMRVVYMSGYPREELSGRLLIEPGAALLQKPFTRAELLDELNKARPGSQVG